MELVVHRIDQRRYATVITRRDGVRFSVNGVGLKFAIPHDLAHLAVEGALPLEHGFWGTVAAGAVFGSMVHVDGRRRPHADERSRELLKSNRRLIGEAEGLVARFNGAFEAGLSPESAVLRNQLRGVTWTPPVGVAREVADREIRAVWAAWHEMQALWNPLPIGGRLEFVWLGESIGNGARLRDRRRRNDHLLLYAVSEAAR